MLTKHAHYDPKEKVIFVDYSNLTLTHSLMKETIKEIALISKGLPEKTFLLVCMQDMQIEESLGEDFGQLSAEALKYVRGVVRYSITSSMANVIIRSHTVRSRLQGIKSHIYPSREAALAAIRQMRAADKTKV